MKDIDDYLQHQKPTPKRELPSDFAQTIAGKIIESPRAEQPRRKGIFRFLQRPLGAVAALVLIVMIIGGTTYAAPQIIKFVNAIFESEVYLNDGSRILTINQADCQVDEGQHSSEKYYYRVKKDAPLTNDQVTQLVQAECELSKEKDYVTIPSEYSYGDAAVPAGAFSARRTQSDIRITAIDQSSISFEEPVVLYGGAVSNKFDYIDYRHRKLPVDSTSLQLFGTDGHPITYSELHVDDRVKLTYVTPSAPSASLPNDDEHSRVIGIQKTSVNITKAREYAAFLGTYFNRVAPCDSDSDGYCVVEASPSLNPPVDYEAYITKTEQLRRLKGQYEAFIADNTKLPDMLSPELRSKAEASPFQALFCVDAANEHTNYMPFAIDKNGNTYIAIDSYYTVLDENDPSAVAVVDGESHQITDISCYDSQRQLFDYMNEVKSKE